MKDYKGRTVLFSLRSRYIFQQIYHKEEKLRHCLDPWFFPDQQRTINSWHHFEWLVLMAKKHDSVCLRKHTCQTAADIVETFTNSQQNYDLHTWLIYQSRVTLFGIRSLSIGSLYLAVTGNLSIPILFQSFANIFSTVIKFLSSRPTLHWLSIWFSKLS